MIEPNNCYPIISIARYIHLSSYHILPHHLTLTYLLQIIAGGNIVVGNSLSLTTKQKTFSVALSRAMAPRARIVVYAVKDGEVLADSLNFFVEDTRLNKVMAI